MSEFYSHRTFIGTATPDPLSVAMARSASAYKVMTEALQAGEPSVLMLFPEATLHDETHTVVHVYGFGDQGDDGE